MSERGVLICVSVNRVQKYVRQTNIYTDQPNHIIETTMTKPQKTFGIRIGILTA